MKHKEKIVLVCVLKLVCQHDLTTAVDVLHYLFFKAADLLPQLDDDGGNLAVVIFEHFNLLFQAGDALQFPSPALGRGDPVPLALSLQLDPLLVLHVNRTHGRRTA